MSFFASTIAFISLFASIAGVTYDAVDVWIDGSSLHGPVQRQNTIFFSQWDASIVAHQKKGHTIAIQLDRKFDPLPFDGVELPTIQAIATVSSKEVINDYLFFLERFSRSKGFTYLILPDTVGYSRFEKDIIQLAAARSPQFFIQNTTLKHEIPGSKKEFIAHVSQTPQILVANQIDNLKKIKKWSSKFLPLDHRHFLAGLEESKKQAFQTIDGFPSALQQSIFEAGVYAVDSRAVLPILKAEVVYLGTNDILKEWIAKYATVYTQRKNGIITIVDHLSDQHIVPQSGDLILTTKKLQSDDVSQLVFPMNIADQEIHMAKMLFGSAPIPGTNESARFIPNTKYLGYSHPINEGLSIQFQDHLDSIGRLAISKFATPGIQMIVVKNGSLIYERSMGTYTYDSIKSVDSATLYDLASLTKVMATLPAIGLLLDRKMINLDDSVSQHLPEFAGSNKGKATIRQLLAHNAGLKSYVPFWSMMLDGDRLDAFYYKTSEDEARDIRSYGFVPDPIMLDSLRSYIVKSDLITTPDTYNYSDLGFMILHLLVERVTEQPFDQFVEEEFYKPMGLTHTTFNPIAKGFDIKSISPTEYDQRFRDHLVWGEVHDRNAAVFGGVAGHAGLFSNARDLAKMMSMYINGGYFGGKRYLSEDILRVFNNRYFADNRRGLGWDKKDGELDAASKHASDQSFGHTGFTGTMVWADPEEDLIFVFLSNRIYPDANNNRLSEHNIRTSMHDSIYESIISQNNLKLN